MIAQLLGTGAPSLPFCEFSVDRIRPFVAFREWRTNSAHVLKNVHQISGVPLAVRVCMHDAGLHEANSQSADFKAIERYESMNSGLVLTTVVCLMWLLKLLIEIASSLRVTIAVAQLCGGSTEVIGGKIKSISMVRMLWFTFAQTTRLAIAVCLGYGGTLFLTHTVKLGDLILNCVALGFVTEVDDGVYAAFCPWQLKQLLAQVEGLLVPRRMRLSFSGLDIGAVIKLIAVLTALGAVFPMLIVPQ